MPFVRTALLATLAVLGGPPLLVAQEPAASGEPEAWNAPRTLELVERGREARQRLEVEGDLESYEALTEGHVYFFLDPEGGERTLIRVDQVAVELRWRAPDYVQQHVIGERTETRLPVRDFRYYLDRLTLVQYGFGDEIQVGAGMDVAGVPHPLAPVERDGEEPYDFRIADSVALTLPGRRVPLRIYEVEVRPRDDSRPGVLGTIHLDRASGEVVRMAITFTPASYVDPRTDRISVELDYGLWEDRYWLPNLQQIEVRRELPELDLGVGTVIRAVLRVGGYDLNAPVPDEIRSSPPVTFAPPDERRAHPFSEGLYDALDRDGLAELLVDPDPRELQARAAEVARDVPPSGLMGLRFHLPRVSSLVRYNRVEGVGLGLGGSYRPTAAIRLRGRAGYAVAPGRPRGALELESRLSARWTLEADARHEGLRDLGLSPAIDPLLGSLSAAVRGEDYQDPYRVSGGRVGVLRQAVGGSSIGGGIGIERHRTPILQVESPPLDGSRDVRPVRGIDAGTYAVADVELRRPIAWPGNGRGWGSVGVEGLTGGPGSGAAFDLGGEARWGPPSATRELQLRGRIHSWLGDDLPQGHRLIGGRGSIPGYAFRSFVGRHAAQSSLVFSSDVLGPFLRGRAGIHLGWTDGPGASVADAWSGATATDGLRASASLGVGIGWDILRVDLARGLRGGEWQILFSLDPVWWDRL